MGKVLAVALCLLAVFALTPADGARGLTPELIDVDVLMPVRDAARAGGGTANCSNDGAGTGKYATTGWVVGSARNAYLNTSTIPGYLGSVTSTLQSAFNAWGAAPNISVVAVSSGPTKATANRQNDLMWGSPGGSIATTYTWRWNDGLVESDVVFNKQLTWFKAVNEGDGCYENQPYYDVENIAVHEFGHVYGLGHPSGARFESMYAYGYTGETLKRSLASGDSVGVNALY